MSQGAGVGNREQRIRLSPRSSAGPEPNDGTGPDPRSDDRRGAGFRTVVYFAVYRKGDVEWVAAADDRDPRPVTEWVGFRTAADAQLIGHCLLAQLDEVSSGLSSGECLAPHPVQSITPFSVRSQDDLLHLLDTVRGHRRAFRYRKYALGAVCPAIPVQAGAAAGAPALYPLMDELHRLRSVTDRLRKMAEATLTTLAFSVSI
ncbi:hypothetical protein [Streptomyces sp. NPDC054765]